MVSTSTLFFLLCTCSEIGHMRIAQCSCTTLRERTADAPRLYPASRRHIDLHLATRPIRHGHRLLRPALHRGKHPIGNSHINQARLHAALRHSAPLATEFGARPIGGLHLLHIPPSPALWVQRWGNCAQGCMQRWIHSRKYSLDFSRSRFTLPKYELRTIRGSCRCRDCASPKGQR